MANFHEKEISKWNVRDFHDYLTALTKDRFGVTYAPFGKGPISTRWRTEQGQVKNAVSTYGAETVKLFIDICVNTYRPTDQYPFINFGFMYAYRRDDLAKAERQLAKQTVVQRTITKQEEVDVDWY